MLGDVTDWLNANAESDAIFVGVLLVVFVVVLVFGCCIVVNWVDINGKRFNSKMVMMR